MISKMPLERVIKQLESLIEETETHIEPNCEQVWIDDKEALEVAINAVRAWCRLGGIHV